MSAQHVLGHVEVDGEQVPVLADMANMRVEGDVAVIPVSWEPQPTPDEVEDGVPSP